MDNSEYNFTLFFNGEDNVKRKPPIVIQPDLFGDLPELSDNEIHQSMIDCVDICISPLDKETWSFEFFYKPKE